MSNEYTEEDLQKKAEKYQDKFSEKGFWGVLAKSAKSIGEPVVRRALEMFYAMTRNDMPIEAKLQIVGALAYLIVPLDLIPDFIPIAGWTDDGTALAFAYGRVQDYIDDTVRQDAQNKMMEFFG